MTERTPEFYQIDKIMDEVIAGGWFDVIDRTIRVDSHAIARLAAPLEAANKTIRELEREVGESKLEDVLDAQAVRTENTALREAVRVMAKEVSEWHRLCIDARAWSETGRIKVGRMGKMLQSGEFASNAFDDAVRQSEANPIARAAISAAKAQKEQA